MSDQISGRKDLSGRLIEIRATTDTIKATAAV
jgi:hypothetical protein